MRSTKAAPAFAASLSAVCLASCSRSHSALSPAGPYAQQIATLTWIFIAVCTAIWLLVMIALAIAIFRQRRARPDPLHTDAPRERRIGRVIGVCIGATAVVVIALTLLSYLSQRGVFANEPATLTVRVTGHQWWWEVHYDDPQPAHSFTSANEFISR